MKLNHYQFIIIIALFSNFQILGQDTENGVTSQYWADYSPSTKISEKVNFEGTIGYRTNSPQLWNRYFIKGKFKYKRKKNIKNKLFYSEQFSAGLGVYYTNNFYVSDRIEIIPVQSYSLTWPNTNKLKLNHNFDLEERFELNTKNWKNNFGLRLSYEPTLTLYFQGNSTEFRKGFYLPVSLYLYWNLIDVQQFNDRIRVTPGIGYAFSPKWKGAFLIGYNYSKVTKDENFYKSDVIFRFRVYHNL
ncbi:DUF2490 domain-containing protein [Lutibacter holmesii]|uniref:DUF2490 domain-containing protein n=1 Tax=Lutibacter holmesii TaxID=1137985 RepID=A0ABW3WJW6_9FLAO